jgi:surface carbohydrate biosynthesis protein
VTSRPRIALFVADPVRDLSGVVLTAFELCQQGAECFVIPFRRGHREVCALAPDFVLLPALRPYQRWSARQYMEAGIQCGFLDAEGVVWSSMDEYRKTIWSDDDLTRKMSCVLAWSPNVAEYLTATGVFEEQQVVVSGCPRFDYYVKPLSRVYKKSVNGSHDSSRKMILLNTNFTIANPYHGKPGTVIERLLENYAYDRSEVVSWYRSQLASLESMSELANQLARDFPQLDILLRPHPQELTSTYLAKLDKLPNLRMTNEGNVTAWILRSTAVIQRSCTTAIEATLAGRLAISPQWIEPGSYYPLPESVSMPCTDYEHVKDVITSISSGEFKLPSEDEARISSVVESAFYRTDGQAHKRVAAAILNSLNSKSPDLSRCRQFLYGIPDSSFGPVQRLPHRIRYHFGLPPTYSFRKMRADYDVELDGYAGAPQIRNLVREIAEAKTEEGARDVSVYSANDVDAYIAGRFQGRSVVMRCS